MISVNYRSDMITQKAMAEVVQAQLARLGVQVIIQPAEPALYYDRRKSGDFGMMPDISWGIQYDPQSIFKFFRDGRRYLAPAFEGEAEELFQCAIRNMDVESRRRQFDRIADIFMNQEFIVIPLTVSAQRGRLQQTDLRFRVFIQRLGALQGALQRCHYRIGTAGKRRPPSVHLSW